MGLCPIFVGLSRELGRDFEPAAEPYCSLNASVGWILRLRRVGPKAASKPTAIMTSATASSAVETSSIWPPKLHIPPEGPSQSSVGVRINRVDYFKGAIRVSRLTRGALTPAEFMKLR